MNDYKLWLFTTVKMNPNLRLYTISRNSAVFYWKSANLIGAPTETIAHVALLEVIFLYFFGLKVHNVQGFGLQLLEFLLKQ